MQYDDKVLDHFTNPRNVGETENASGDIMKVYLNIDDNDIIRDVKFKTFGCGAAITASSMSTELIKSINDTLKITNQAVCRYHFGTGMEES